VSLPSPEELLVQARDLTTKVLPATASQASLRRAVSTAYYAVFHLLIQDAAEFLAAGDPKLEALMARAFEHGEMARACAMFASSGKPLSIVQALYGNPPVPAELRDVADAFVQLQKARTDADYSTHRTPWTVTEAEGEVERAEDAFRTWRDIRPQGLRPRPAVPAGGPPRPARNLAAADHEAVRLFLACLVG
jgi:hypothetical protein